jgi:LPS sulfotransferase NodH
MKTIIICTLPRTGSSFLAERLRLTGVMGRPREYFHPNQRAQLTTTFEVPADDIKRYAAEIIERRSSPNGVVSAKLMVTHLRDLVSHRLVEPPALRSVIELFGSVADATVIRLLRRDKVRQAISLVRARQTGEWSSLTAATHESPEYDADEIERTIVRLVKLEGLWDVELAAAGLVPALDVIYEDMTADVESVVREVGRAAGIVIPEQPAVEQPEPSRQHQRQRDAITEAWVEWFLGG